jgi:hypothetical protein
VPAKIYRAGARWLHAAAEDSVAAGQDNDPAIVIEFRRSEIAGELCG